jgi:hypothetical protein
VADGTISSCITAKIGQEALEQNTQDLKMHKKMRNTVLFSFIFFLAILLNYNNTEGKQMIKGTLYLGGEVLNKIDLNTKKWELVYGGATPEGFGWFEYPNILNNDLFILCTGNISIQYFNLKDKKFVSITKGERPLYIKESNTLIYYKYKEGVFRKTLGDNGQEEFVTNNIYGLLVKISPPEIAYYNKDKKIEIYNLSNKTFRILDITDYNPWAFYSKRNSLICKSEKDNNFYFVNVSTLEKEKINIKNPKLVKWCVIPVEEYNCLVYSKIRVVFIAEYEDMHIYWIDEGKEELFLKNNQITSGVYARVE